MAAKPETLNQNSERGLAFVPAPSSCLSLAAQTVHEGAVRSRRETTMDMKSETEQMRECLKDLADSGCFLNLSVEDVNDLTDAQVRSGVARHYGLAQFRADYLEVL